jgi:hypothetical protein
MPSFARRIEKKFLSEAANFSLRAGPGTTVTGTALQMGAENSALVAVPNFFGS